MDHRFRDRRHAGQVLAELLEAYRRQPNLLILGLPRGGVPVGFEIARALDAPLDVFLVRKLGVPGHEELAMGAIASGGVRVENEEVVRLLGIPSNVLEAVAVRETAELERREAAFRPGRPPVDVSDRIVILVDDGLATGSTMRAAARALAQMDPEELVMAVPTAGAATVENLRDEVDRVVVASLPEPFFAVGLSYEDFTQVTDRDVRRLLAAAARFGGGGRANQREGPRVE